MLPASEALLGWALRAVAPHLVCFNPDCRKRYRLDQVVYSCAACGSLLEVANDFGGVDPAPLRREWRARRHSLHPIDVSGVWRFREMLPFVRDPARIVSLPEGNTPLFDAPIAARGSSSDGTNRAGCAARTTAGSST